MRACPNCGEEGPEGARFCPACGMALASATPSRQEVRKVVTIVFCDLSGSTSLGERLDPESVRQMINRYFKAMSDALERHGGTVEKFIGDAVMAVFGIPTVREDDALRAVRAAAEMRTALEELNEQLQARWGVQLRVRTGVNTGEVIAGDPSRGHGFATGDAVNVAARFEQAAGAGEILIGEQTFQLVRDAVRVEAVAPLDLKGKSDPVPAFRLIEVADHAGLGGRPSLPLVGRERELALLREAFERTILERTCELVTVVGPAGIGKSRLTKEFTDTLGGAATIVVGRCLSYGDGLTFWPLREVVEGLAGTDDRESSEEAQSKIARLLPEGDDKATIVERVGGAVGLSDAAAYPTETAWAVRKLLEAAAAQQPLVVLFEDLHWAEPTFLELVKYLAGTIRGVPILIVAIARPELLDASPDFAGALAGASRMELQPLSGDESRALIEHLIGDATAASELSQRVFTAGGGNPLFVEELVRMLADERQLKGDEASSSWAHELSTLSVPPTIHALLAARLERLDPAERAVVEAAAVVGGSFGGGAVFELGGDDDRSELDRHLRALVGKDLIQPDGGRFAGEPTFSFKHMLLRDVAYRGILKEVRADIHARFADWLEGAAGERASEYEEMLGYHLERAYRYRTELGPIDQLGRELATRAAGRLGTSGRRALARGDIPPAVNLLERAVSLLPDDDPTRRDLTLKLGIALAETGQLTRADVLLHDRIESERRGRTFVVFHDATGKQHVVSLDDEESAITIGRRVENDVALSWDNDVSRRHAELRRAPEGWTLVDEGSRNGSYLNGRRVRGRHPLRDGDVLRFGDTVVLFRSPAADEQAISVQPGQVTSLGQRPTHWAAPSETDAD
ncbi:MAG TPA: adenylate/guanylate cyclase domain-containing protein [Thermoleophilaceae bacterium]|nr:adenylate/guanylate cyclase domain-containing protein [Thermoleophilaceae bacterium]